jgi:protein-S-isoprenylcysteine O-methyltransferase Ste14
MTSINSAILWCAVVLGIVALGLPILFAVRNSRRQKGRMLGRGAGTRSWPFLVLTTVLLTGIGLILWRPISLPFPESVALLVSIFGAALYFPGIALYIWSLSVLDAQFGVSGIFGAELYAGHALVRRGPFGIIRHPMYLGVLLAAAGALLIFRTWAMLLFAPLSFVVVLRAEKEEKLLAEEFGEAWKAYACEVPQWLPNIFRRG